MSVPLPIPTSCYACLRPRLLACTYCTAPLLGPDQDWLSARTLVHTLHRDTDTLDISVLATVPERLAGFCAEQALRLGQQAAALHTTARHVRALAADSTQANTIIAWVMGWAPLLPAEVALLCDTTAPPMGDRTSLLDWAVAQIKAANLGSECRFPTPAAALAVVIALQRPWTGTRKEHEALRRALDLLDYNSAKPWFGPLAEALGEYLVDLELLLLLDGGEPPSSAGSYSISKAITAWENSSTKAGPRAACLAVLPYLVNHQGGTVARQCAIERSGEPLSHERLRFAERFEAWLTEARSDPDPHLRLIAAVAQDDEAVLLAAGQRQPWLAGIAAKVLAETGRHETGLREWLRDPQRWPGVAPHVFRDPARCHTYSDLLIAWTQETDAQRGKAALDWLRSTLEQPKWWEIARRSPHLDGRMVEKLGSTAERAWLRELVTEPVFVRLHPDLFSTMKRDEPVDTWRRCLRSALDILGPQVAERALDRHWITFTEAVAPVIADGILTWSQACADFAGLSPDRFARLWMYVVSHEKSRRPPAPARRIALLQTTLAQPYPDEFFRLWDATIKLFYESEDRNLLAEWQPSTTELATLRQAATKQKFPLAQWFEEYEERHRPPPAPPAPKAIPAPVYLKPDRAMGYAMKARMFLNGLFVRNFDHTLADQPLIRASTIAFVRGHLRRGNALPGLTDMDLEPEAVALEGQLADSGRRAWLRQQHSPAALAWMQVVARQGRPNSSEPAWFPPVLAEILADVATRGSAVPQAALLARQLWFADRQAEAAPLVKLLIGQPNTELVAEISDEWQAWTHGAASTSGDQHDGPDSDDVADDSADDEENEENTDAQEDGELTNADPTTGDRTLAELARTYALLSQENAADERLRGLAEQLAATALVHGFSETESMIRTVQINARCWLAELELQGGGSPEKVLDWLDPAYSNLDAHYRLAPLIMRGAAAHRLGYTDEAWALMSLATRLFPDDARMVPAQREPAAAWEAAGGWPRFLPLGRPGETASEALDRYHEFHQRCHHLMHGAIAWGKPLAANDIAAAESALGIRFPAGYVRLLTDRGTFSLADGRDGSCNGAMDLIEPEGVAEASNQMREWLGQLDEVDDDFDPARTFVIQWMRYDSDPDAYGFNPDQTNPNGEPDILELRHDDSPGFSASSFDQHISDLVDTWMLGFVGEEPERVRDLVKPAMLMAQPAEKTTHPKT